MRVVGRKREKDQGEPKGVRTIAGRWYWQPPTEVERAERRAKGLPASVPLGKAGTVQARMKWSELTGISDDAANPGTIADLLTRFNEGDPAPILTQRNGKPRSASTVAQYRRRLPALYKKVGGKVYGRTESDVMRGKGINAGELQKIIRASGSLGRAYLAILDAAFDNAILCGLTTYNPCAAVTALAITPRTREPLEWEMECLGTLARPVIGLILETKAISGYRISEVLRAHRRDMHDRGIRFTVKGGKTETLLWSPMLRAIVAEAERLPKATKFPASPLFPNRRGRAYSYSGWEYAWLDLRAEANAALAAGGVIDPDTLERHDPLSIEDLHVHDVRSKVHDDARDMGRKGHEQIGDTKAVADRHYSRREKNRTPLR
jgi:integrase